MGKKTEIFCGTCGFIQRASHLHWNDVNTKDLKDVNVKNELADNWIGDYQAKEDTTAKITTHQKFTRTINNE